MAVTDRVKKHPVLPVKEAKSFSFFFDGRELTAREGEVISSSLFANGITVFGHHYLDNSPQGIFCANGQCSQCLVIADGMAVKACMTMTRPGMKVQSCEGLPDLPADDALPDFSKTEVKECDVLIVGGGPSGISAAVELGRAGTSVILVDDKDKLGGKLVLQTHTFFGSMEDCYAGTRGIEIAEILEKEVSAFENVEVMLNASATGVFSDKVVGVFQDEKHLYVKPKKLLIAAGARERALSFPGWNLPGVYGAGAFQTLLNRDLVRPSKRLFIIGGGNVGLIAAYHALQADITVVGLAEALPEVSGYKVHADKIIRLGVPIYKSHSIVRAEGTDEGVERITIAEVDDKFKIIEGTEKTFEVDTILVAVGLTPVSEMYDAAKRVGIDVYAAGDAFEIAEASAAMFGGKIAGRRILNDFGIDAEIPESWAEKEEILKSRPGGLHPRTPSTLREGVFPVFHCSQEIPCNPCTEVCPYDSIVIEGDSMSDKLMKLPEFKDKCAGCNKCVAVCPGLAVTTVDFRKIGPDEAFVTLPFELSTDGFNRGDVIPILNADGKLLGDAEITSVKSPKFAGKTSLITVRMEADKAVRAAGIKVQKDEDVKPMDRPPADPVEDPDEVMACSCMRVKKGDVVRLIRQGVRDMNQLKGELNIGMGACGGKTCEQLVMRIFREEGVDLKDVTPYTKRAPSLEIPLGVFAGIEK